MATEREIILKLKADTSGVEQGLNNVEESLKEVNKEIDKMGQAGKSDPFAKKLDELNKKVESGTLSMREMTKAVKEYATLALQAGENSPIGKEALNQAGQLKDRIGDLNAAVNDLSKDGRGLQTALQLGSGIVAGYTAFQGVTALLGKENEDLQKTFVKLQAAQSALMGIESLHASLQKETLLRKKLDAIATNAMSAAQATYSAVVGTSTGALKLFRIALISTGIGAILVGLGLLIANFDKVQAFVQKAIKEFGNLHDVLLILLGPIGWIILAYQKLFGEEAKLASAREKASKQITDNYNKEVEQLKEKRRIEKEAFEDKQTEFDLNIARAKAEGKNIDALTIQKLEAVLAEKKAVLQLNQDLINAMVERYTLEAELRGKSLDDFLASVGINKDVTERMIKDQLKSQEDAVFSAETDLIAFRNEAAKGVEAPVTFKFPEIEHFKAKVGEFWTTFNEMWNQYPPINIADKFEVEPESFELIPEEEITTALGKVESFFAQLRAYRETGSENIKAELSESLKVTQDIAQQAMDTLSAFNDFANQISDNKIAKIQRDAKKELSVNGLTAQQKFEIEMKTAEAVDKINKRKFQRDKALRIASAVIDGAGATVKALGSAPPPVNFVLAGLVGAAAAAQIATISAQQFEGSAGTITPPNFSNVGGGDSNGNGGNDNNNQTGSQQNNITTNTDNLINGIKPTKVILSMVELNETQDEMNQIESVSSIGGSK